jgi:hypothetical protein
VQLPVALSVSLRGMEQQSFPKAFGDTRKQYRGVNAALYCEIVDETIVRLRGTGFFVRNTTSEYFFVSNHHILKGMIKPAGDASRILHYIGILCPDSPAGNTLRIYLRRERNGGIDATHPIDVRARQQSYYITLTEALSVQVPLRTTDGWLALEHPAGHRVDVRALKIPPEKWNEIQELVTFEVLLPSDQLYVPTSGDAALMSGFPKCRDVASPAEAETAPPIAKHVLVSTPFTHNYEDLPYSLIDTSGYWGASGSLVFQEDFRAVHGFLPLGVFSGQLPH